MNKSLTFMSYARRSSQGESKQIESIGDQEKMLREVADRCDLRVKKWHSEAKTAQVPGVRPVFRAMLDAIKAGEANAILCWHVDRLSRNPAESGELQQLLHDSVIQCVKTPEREYHPEDHALLFAIESSMAWQYSRDLKRNVARGVREKVQRGWYPYTPKPGYTVEEGTRNIVPHPERFALLRRAWEHMLTGDRSVPEVLSSLNALGYRTARTKSGGSKPMNRSSLYRIFIDPFYAGTFMFEGAEIEGKHTPMVTMQEFEQVQGILGRPLRAKPQQNFHRYAGLMRCGVCGCQITAETKVKHNERTGHLRRYTYYHCTGQRGCPKRSVTEAELEKQIVARLAGCQLDPFFIEWALQAAKREEESMAAVANASETAVSGTCQSLRRKIDRLFEMLEEGDISIEEFRSRKEQHEGALKSLKKEEQWTATKQTRDLATIRNLLAFSKNGYRHFITQRPEAQRLVARVFAKEYVLTQGTLRISTHPGLDKIRTFEPQKSWSHQVCTSGSSPSSSIWQAWWDELLKIVASTEQPFEDGLPDMIDEQLVA